MLCIFEAFYFEIYHSHGDATQTHTCLAMKNNVQKETNILKSLSLLVPWRLFLQVHHLVTFLASPQS